jgi:autotransporter-associated beta strand protein
LGKQLATAANTISFGGGTLQYSAANTFDYSGRFSTAANQPISIDPNGQSVTFAQALKSSGGSLTLLGSGTLTVSATNTYTGATTVSGGTLVVSGSLAGTTSITGTSGGTIKLNAADVLNHAAHFTLAGATFNSNTLNAQVADLTIASGSSTLSLGGTAASTLHFGDSHTLAGNWTGTLTITNWNAAALGATGINEIFFGSANTGLTTGQVADINFLNPTINGTLQSGLYSAAILSSGEVVALAAIPEPGTWAMLVGGFGMLIAGQRMRRRHPSK